MTADDISRMIDVSAVGVRGLETLVEMYRRGARRFGLSWKGAVTVLQKVRALPSGAVEI
jgi:hypothetical protein